MPATYLNKGNVDKLTELQQAFMDGSFVSKSTFDRALKIVKKNKKVSAKEQSGEIIYVANNPENYAKFSQEYRDELFQLFDGK